MFGIGGGVVIVPALILFSGFSITQANGTSLAALLLPVGILAVIQYYKSNLIDIRISLLIAGGLLVGVIFGSLVALNLPIPILKAAYAIFLFYVSWTFVRPYDQFLKLFGKERKNQDNQKGDNPKNLKFYSFLYLGVFAGILSGLFGIGGGLVIVPFLIKFLGFDTKKAVGTSLGALLLPVGLPGVILYSQSGAMNIMDAVPVAIGLLLGAFIGAVITIAMPIKTVKKVYGLFLFIISIYFLYQGIIKI